MILVGRDAELRQLRARLDGAAEGSGLLVVVAGEPGIGKTALARQVLGEARDRGFDVAWASCWQTAAVPPLWPWTQLLGQLAGGDGQMPELAVEGVDVDAALAEQSRRVTAWLADRRARPTALVLDDVHWADAATLRLVGEVASVAAASCLLLVATARALAADASPAYVRGAAQLRRLGEELSLSGLGVAETAALVAAITGVAPDVGVARDLRELTGGNPLFAREIGRTLGAEELAGAFDASSVVAPRSVTDLVAARLQALSPAGRSLLDTVAVAGDATPLDVLSEIMGIGRPALLDLVDEARGVGLAQQADDATTFSHALFRTAVYELLPLAGRARVHDAVGRALLARRERGLAVDTAALAHHFGRSSALGDAPMAFGFAIEASREATALLSFDLAVRRLEQALALRDADPDLGPRLPILLELGDALSAQGRAEEGRRIFAEAAVEARRTRDAQGLGRAALGFSGGLGGIEVPVGDRATCDLLEEAAELLRDDLVLGPMLDARRSVALSFLAPLQERTAIADDACQRARSGGDPAAIAHTVAAWLDVIAGPGHVGQRTVGAAEVIANAARCGDLPCETLGRRLLVEALMEAGALDEAAAEIDRFHAAAQRLGRLDYTWYPSLWRAALAFARGDLLAERRHLSALAAQVGEAGGGNAELLARVHDVAAGLDLADVGRVQAAGSAIARMGLPLDEPQFRTTMTYIAEMTGVDGAPREAAGSLANDALTADRDSEWLPMMVQVGEIALLQGDLDTAKRAREALDPFGDVWVVEGIGAGIRGPVHRMLGRLAAACGDVGAAGANLRSARAATARAGAHLLTALVDHEEGLALGEGALIERAAVFWRSVGAQARLAQLDLSSASPVAPAPNQFVRTGESWSLRYDDRSCSLRDSKGLRDLARLVAQPGREIAALDLAAAAGGPRQGDAGEALDTTARDAYRRRLVELQADLDEADGFGDLERSERLAAERDALLGELTSAYGLGGRARRPGGDAERARTAVRARIRDALDRIEAADPVLGRHLRRSVRTGTFCVYDPDPVVAWEV